MEKSFISFDARGIIIKIPIDIAFKCEVIKNIFSHKKENETYFLNYCAEEVHLFFDYLSGRNIKNKNKIKEICEEMMVNLEETEETKTDNKVLLVNEKFCPDIKLFDTTLSTMLKENKSINWIIYIPLWEFSNGQTTETNKKRTTMLFNIIKLHPQITTLDIRSMENMTNSCRINICEQLVNIKHITTLILHKDSLDDECASILSRSNTILRLDVSNNEITSYGMRLLMANLTFQYINIENNSHSYCCSNHDGNNNEIKQHVKEMQTQRNLMFDNILKQLKINKLLRK